AGSAGAGGGAMATAAPSAAAGSSSGAGARLGDSTRFAVKRPNMVCLNASVSFPSSCSPCRRQAARAFGRGRLALRRRVRLDELLELGGDGVARLHLFERDATVDRFAHQRVVVGNGPGERAAERLLEIGAPQAGPEHALLEAVDDDLRLHILAEALLDGGDQVLRIAQARHGRFGDD